MDRGVAFALTAGAGGLIALQAPINATLGKAIGTWQAVFFSFLTGTLVLAVIVAFASGGFGQIAEARSLPLYYLVGGILGAVYVTCSLISVRAIGAGGIAAATIAGQLTLSIIVDRLGLFGVTQSPITVAKVIGVALLVIGALLIIRR